MVVNATDFKNKVGKYLDIINQEEVIISRNGKPIAKLVPIDKASTPNVDGLMELLDKVKKNGLDADLNQLREDRYKKYESLT
jgi:prevent-host-death family protein